MSTEQSQAGREKFGQRPDEKEPTSEQFVEEENEQLMKSLKLQEVNSLVQTPRAMIQHLETDCENIFNTSKHRESNHFTKVFEDPSFWKRVSFGMCYKTTADAAACREYTHTLVLIQIPEFIPQSQDEQELNQFFKFI